MYAKAGYYAVFTMAFGLIGVDVVLRVLLVEKKIARQWNMEQHETASPVSPKDEKLPVPATEEPAILATQQPDTTVGQPTVVPGETSSGIKHPILLLLTSRRLLAACYTTLSYAILMTAWDAVLPLRVHDLFGWSSLGAGLIFLPLILPSMYSEICLDPPVSPNLFSFNPPKYSTINTPAHPSLRCPPNRHLYRHPRPPPPGNPWFPSRHPDPHPPPLRLTRWNPSSSSSLRLISLTRSRARVGNDAFTRRIHVCGQPQGANASRGVWGKGCLCYCLRWVSFQLDPFLE